MTIWTRCPRCEGQNIPVTVEDRGDGFTPEPSMATVYPWDGKPSPCLHCGYQVSGQEWGAIDREAKHKGYAIADDPYPPEIQG